MAVNIAAQQLAKTDFVDEVVDVLRRTGLPAERLVLEITESVLLDDMADTIATLARLRDRGIRVAIDDFGTGYSSLSYLAQLPVDVLKIDKSFVDKVGGGYADASLVEAIIAMSHSMRLTTVAEGVEQSEQAAWLQDARCSLGQGYLWSRPVDLASARELLRPRHAPPRGRDRRGRRPARHPRRADRVSPRRSGRAQQVEDAGVLDRGGHGRVLAVGDLAHRLAQDLAAAGLRQPADDRTSLNAATAPISVAHQRDQLARRRRRGRSVTPALSTTKPRGTWPFSGVGHADHRALRDRRVRGEHRLHRPGREPVAGHVDDVVGAAHHEQVAVLVDVPAVAGEVVALEGGEVRRRRTARRRPTASSACPVAAAA